MFANLHSIPCSCLCKLEGPPQGFCHCYTTKLWSKQQYLLFWMRFHVQTGRMLWESWNWNWSIMKRELLRMIYSRKEWMGSGCLKRDEEKKKRERDLRGFLWHLCRISGSCGFKAMPKLLWWFNTTCSFFLLKAICGVTGETEEPHIWKMQPCPAAITAKATTKK